MGIIRVVRQENSGLFY